MTTIEKVAVGRKSLKLSFDNVCTWITMAYMASGFVRTILGVILSKLRMGSMCVLVANIVIYFSLCVVLFFEVANNKYRRGIGKFAVVFLLTALLFFITLIIHPSYEEYFTRPIFGVIDSVFRPDFGAIWGFFIIVVCCNSERLYKNIYLGVWCLAAYCVYQYVVFLMSGYWSVYNYLGELKEQTYSLDFSYSCCLCVCVFLINYFRERRTKDIVMLIVTAIMMVMGGSRGALVCFAVFVVLYYFREFMLLSLKMKLAVLAVVAVVAVAIYLLLPTVITVLSKVDSRSIQSIVTGTFSMDNGREQIHALAEDAMSDMPFLGYGPFGDRPFIAPHYYWGYVHNLIYEMVIDFGWVVGITILLIILSRCVIVYMQSDDYDLAIISLLIGMNFKLFMSASFWASAEFWMLIAYLFAYDPVKKSKVMNRIRLRLFRWEK